MVVHNQSEEVLKRKGIRITKHRYAILKVLQESTEPLSVEGIYSSLKSQGVSINYSTIYRTLDALIGKDLIIKTILEDRAVYEFNYNEHKHHVVCMRCKKMIPVEHCPFEEYEKMIKEELNFNVTKHKLEIYGYCADCDDDHNDEK